ncbi:MAG TPA: hypothetical protein VK501_14905 [Baekduia sp.]|uniref:hypothetical protein n=1 Tax=Baekduia sp. TaxID=2600305 RepID=UPI002BFB46E1|nr:hypothetical protein [Baekduia sp.]HMJ35198.1 hypothetical protein [Baekduia sp.]
MTTTALALPSPAAAGAATPTAPRWPLPDPDCIRSEPPTPPMALGQGYSAALEGRPASSNPYALGLPSDNESRAQLWDDGLRVGRLRRQLI